MLPEENHDPMGQTSPTKAATSAAQASDARPAAGQGAAPKRRYRLKMPPAKGAAAASAIPSVSLDYQVKVAPIEAYRRFWTRWTVKGRASRSEFWWALLLNTVIGFALALLGAVALGDATPVRTALGCWADEVMVAETTWLACFLFDCFASAVCIPMLCLYVRRLHDAGRCGWWLLALVALVLVVSAIFPRAPLGVLLFALQMSVGCSPSEKRENRFGPIPNWTKR